ncbi:MAG: hypothetical protein EA374_03625 [Acholeplasmatales bacterium]|nr:MAG: hypothetical protein EA374_03625 [Acholeplasmatales bacterium]
MLFCLTLFGLVIACEGLDTVDDPDVDQGTDPDPVTVVIEPVEDHFDFDLRNTLEYTLDIDTASFSHVRGLNITTSDYQFDAGRLVIEPAFLARLDAGAHTLTLVTTEAKQTFTVHILDRNNRYRIINGGFESGDLFGWTAHTIFKGEQAIQAFVDEGIRPNTTFFSFAAPYEGEGDYVYGFDDRDGIDKDRWNERIGRLTSSPFELGGSGHISFMLGGGRHTGLLFVSVRRLSDDVEIARFGNTEFNQVPYFLEDGETVNPDYREANLVRYVANLQAHLGEVLYFDIQDLGGRDWDLFTLDSFETYHASIPVFEEAFTAVNLLPEISDVDTPPLAMNNQDFSEGLQGWQVHGENTAFYVEDGALKSNLMGDASIGLIRSPAFRLDPSGSGFISFELAAGQGARFDKDTFVSVREAHTHREIFRTANTRSDGNTFIAYFIDLQDHLGKTLYLEIVDNATGAWDTLFIRNIETHYPEKPVILPPRLAENLLE